MEVSLKLKPLLPGLMAQIWEKYNKEMQAEPGA